MIEKHYVINYMNYLPIMTFLSSEMKRQVNVLFFLKNIILLRPLLLSYPAR